MGCSPSRHTRMTSLWEHSISQFHEHLVLGLVLCTWGATLIQITHMLHVCNLTVPGYLPANPTLLSFLPNASYVPCFPPFQSLRKIWSVKSVAELPLTSVTLGVKLSAYETYTFLFGKLSNISKGSFQSCSSPKCSAKVLCFFLLLILFITSIYYTVLCGSLEEMQRIDDMSTYLNI